MLGRLFGFPKFFGNFLGSQKTLFLRVINLPGTQKLQKTTTEPLPIGRLLILSHDSHVYVASVKNQLFSKTQIILKKHKNLWEGRLTSTPI